MPIIGFVQGLPVYEERAIVHDPATGRFTSNGSGGSSGRNKSMVEHAMQQSHPDHTISKAVQHIVDKGTKIGKADSTGKSAVHVDGDHVGHVESMPGFAFAHHPNGDRTSHKNTKEAAKALGEKHFESLVHHVESKAAEKRSADIHAKHGPVPKFENAQDAAKWLSQRYSGSFNLEGMHHSHVQSTVEVYHKLVNEHKWAQNAVGTLKTHAFKGDAAGTWAMALSQKRSPQSHIFLNSHKYQANYDEAHAEFRKDLKSGYSATSHPEAVVTHEFGHAVHTALHDAAGKHKLKAKLVEWEKAAFGNKKERASDYGRTNTQEAFAESFAQMHHTPREAWAPSTHKLHALMEHFNNNHPDHKDSWHSL